MERQNLILELSEKINELVQMQIRAIEADRSDGEWVWEEDAKVISAGRAYFLRVPGRKPCLAESQGRFGWKVLIGQFYPGMKHQVWTKDC